MKSLLNSLLLISCSVTMTNTIDPQLLIDHVKKSIELADQQSSNLIPEILCIEGMSSSRVRHLLNNLCTLINGSYLEIGTWKGSTFVSALFDNTNTLKKAIAIDNWSEFGDVKNDFLAATQKFLPAESFTFYESNAFSIDLNLLTNPVNIYFYDGNHSTDSQYKAFSYFNSIFADTFIAVIDDWNWESVKKGTYNAFRDLGYTILFEQSLPGKVASDKENWWNGLYVAVIKK